MANAINSHAAYNTRRSSRPRLAPRGPGFWQKYIFSTDHKIIGIQYGITGADVPVFRILPDDDDALAIGLSGPADSRSSGKLLYQMLGEDMVGKDAGHVGVIMPDLYNSFGAMHGTIMVFLAIVPLAFAAFGNFVVPLQIGAPDMTFPRVNMVSYQFYFMGGVMMLASFFIPGGAAKSGWTSYSPLATIATWPASQRADVLDHRHGLPDHLVAAGRGQFHHHHHSIAAPRA